MSRRSKKQYGRDGQYYRKRITRPDGKTEDVYARTVTELNEKVIQRKAALAAGVKPQEMYVFEYCAGFFARKAPHLSPDRQNLYQSQINKVICPVIGGKLLRDVTLDDLKDVLATRAHLGHRSQEDTVQIVKQIFSAAADADVIPKDPSLKLRAGGRPGAPKQALTEAQAAKLLAAVRGLKVEPFVMLGLYTGMRRGEICGLRWSCVHLDGPAPYIEVRRACRWPDHIHPEVTDDLKSPAAFRDIPIPPQLVDYLKALRGSLPIQDGRKTAGWYVYSSGDGHPVSLSTLRRRWETIRTRSTASGRDMGEKIPRHKVTVTLDFMPTPHILRHTYVTRLVLSKMDLKRVQYLAGHADPEITLRIYTSLQQADPAALSADIWAAFDAADGEE